MLAEKAQYTYTSNRIRESLCQLDNPIIWLVLELRSVCIYVCNVEQMVEGGAWPVSFNISGGCLCPAAEVLRMASLSSRLAFLLTQFAAAAFPPPPLIFAAFCQWTVSFSTGRDCPLFRASRFQSSDLSHDG